MAIARDSSSNGLGHLTTSVTVAHTVVGTPTMGFTFVIDQGGDTVSGVTWNGVAMTQITKHIRGAVEFIYLYAIANPTTGNIIASRASSSFDIAIGSEAYTGAAATVTVDSFTHAESSIGTTVVTNLTTIADNCWVFLGASNGGSSALTAGTNATVITAVSTDVGKIFDNQTFGSVTPAGSFAMTVAGNIDGVAIGTLAVSFAPTATASSWSVALI